MTLICFLSLVLSARRTLIGFDGYWHLKMGKDWVENGLSPFVDHYSFTFNGAEILPVPVLFQAAFYWFVSTFGLQLGPEIFKLALYTLVLGMVLIYLRQVRAPVFAWCIALPLVVAVMEFRAIVRPELFSYSLSVLALLLYRYRDGELSARTVLPIALLMWFWSNYHSPVIGYVIFFGYFIDAGVRQLRDKAPLREWAVWLGWGLLVVGVGALVPGFQHPIYNLLFFDPQWKEYIAEYQSPFVYKYGNFAAIYALITVTLATAFLSFRQVRYGYLAILVVLVIAGLTMVRMIPPAGIIIACMFAHVLSESDWQSRLRAASAPARNAVGVVIAVLVVLPLWTALGLAKSYVEENARIRDQFPFDVIEHMKENQLAGNLFNEYKHGGFLIYMLSPQNMVYIDGRTHILYPFDHALRAAEALKAPDVLREEAEKYDISFALLPSTPQSFFIADESGSFGLTYVGKEYSLFARERPAFPRFGHLLARPLCWDETWVPELRAETVKAAQILPANSDLWAFLVLVMDYANSPDRADYLRAAAESGTWNDINLRFAAARSLDEGSDELAIQFLNAISAKGLKDYLTAVFTLIRLGRLDDAERNLRVISETYWPYVETVDIVVIQGLLRQLQAQRPLTRISDVFLDYVNRTVADSGLGERDYEVTTELLCAPKGWEKSLMVGNRDHVE